MSVGTMLDEFRKLSPKDQQSMLESAHEIVEDDDRFEDDEGPDGSELDPALRALLRERWNAFERDPARRITWEQIVDNCKKAIQP